MGSALLKALPFAAAIAAIAFACGGGSNSSGFGSGNPDGSASSGSGGGSGGGSSGAGSGSGCGLVGCGEGGSSGGPGPCQGLQCAAVDCASMGKSETTLTGTVYDPAGDLPLYNVYVYVPNAAVMPITPGHPTCTQCEAPASGQPIIGVQTDPTGKFTLTKAMGDDWGVPTGNNGGKGIPLVLQVGKWRKQLTIPSVAACTTTDLDPMFNSGTGTARQLRLPAKSSEGDMPFMAFTSGCDPAECFLRHIGIDDSEFVAPSAGAPPAFPQTAAGAGHVHFYQAYNGPTGIGQTGSNVTGGGTPGQTYAWWGNSGNLLDYDIVFNACECYPNDRGAASYGAMDVFLRGGGRLFTTHYYGNWFIPNTGTADLQSVAQWGSTDVNNPAGWNGTNLTFPEADTVNQTFPKGMAYAQWLQTVATLVGNPAIYSNGTIQLTDTRDDMIAASPAGCTASTCLSTSWIYDASEANHPRYLSFNTPVGEPVTSQCGRAVYSDVHLSGVSDGSNFPAECNDPSIDSPSGHAVNEKALEFLFFDLSSCVQNEGTTPPPPPPAQ